MPNFNDRVPPDVHEAARIIARLSLIRMRAALPPGIEADFERTLYQICRDEIAEFAARRKGRERQLADS
jgi:hypothetical protein